MKDLKDKSLEELKIMAYDGIRDLEQLKEFLKVLNITIANRENEQAKKKGDEAK